jgi:release factor glutamine methyltransferase
MRADDSPWSVAAALAWAPQHLPAADSPALDAALLLAHVLGQARGWLLAHGERILADSEARDFRLLVERRATGEPVAYLVGHREFWSLMLRVTPAVLVPRPETELVVERALALLPASAAAVADLGTGSGAIALALARERPQWRLTATDRSAQALALAAENARSLRLENVRFAAGDWFNALGTERYALIASNPPYIASGDPALADLALQHEPPEALSCGADGLSALAALIVGARNHLLPGGWLVLEHGATQAGDVATLLVAQGYAHVRCHADLAGRPRVTEACHA